MRDSGDGQLIVAEPAGRYARRLPIVTDCSIIASLLFDETGRDAAAEVLRGRDLFAPDLIDHELVSVAVRKFREGHGQAAEQALVDLERLALTRCTVDRDSQWRFALRYELSAYDAAYLCLAADLGAPLTTFDRKLGEAARKHLAQG